MAPLFTEMELSIWLGVAAALALIGALHSHAQLRFTLRSRTSRLRAEIEALQDRLFHLSESDERHRSLVEAQGDYIVRRDAAGRITFANEAYAAMLGMTADALTGSTNGPAVLEGTPPHERHDGARLHDERVAAANGERWIAWIETAVATRDGGQERLQVGRDVTERVRAARETEQAQGRAEAASDAKTRFLAMVSHEMRTPLSGIVGMAGLLRETRLDAEQQTYVSAVTSSAEALLSLIDGMLDISRIETGHLDIHPAPFDLHALAESVVELLAPKAQHKGIEIAVSVAADVPRRVVGDIDRLRQVIVNLAGNAVKFTSEGGVGVTLAREADGRIALTVADTGPGISAESLPHIFDEFERADAARSGPEGAGLGLAITRGIVERMEGTITVTSAVGQGSAFVVRLPLPEAENAAIARPDLSATRMLVVSQSPFEGPFIAERLGEAGAQVERVSGVHAAQTLLASASYDLVIVDRAMGEEATLAISAAARQAGARQALVLLSPFERRAFGSPTDAGFDGYLVKPVRARSLFARLAQEVAAAGASGAPEPPPAPTARPARRVLLAEDSAVNALLARRLIERLGGIVEHVETGREALDRVRIAQEGQLDGFDVALLDIRMPGMDGMAVARAIREAEAAAGLPRLHLIAVTANVSGADRAAAMAAGFDAFLPKPLSAEALADLLDADAPAAGARLPPEPSRRLA